MAAIDEGTLHLHNGAWEPAPSSFNWQTFETFEKEAARPIEWIVDGLLPAVGLTLLVGEPFVGKSRFMSCLFAARSKPADGDAIAGLKVRPGRSALLSMEHAATGVAASLAAARRGRKLKTVNALILRNKPLINILDAAQRAELIDDLNRKDIDLVGFDSIRRIPNFRENHSEDVAAVMNAFNEICDERRAVVAYHHTPRGEKGRPRGSADFEASSEAVIAVTGKQGGVLTLTVTNHAADAAKFYMLPVHSGPSGDPHATLIMQQVDAEQMGAEAQNEEEKLRGDILEYMGQHPEGVSARDLMTVSGKRYAAVCAAVSDLAREGSIVKGKGKKPWTRA